MTYIEMSRDEEHGGGEWAFTKCVWAPTEKRSGGSWPFWTKIQQVRTGDTIIHLRGKPPNASFVGFSVASGDGFETIGRPPDPKEWNYARKFFRANLNAFTPFHQPIALSDVFTSRKTQLESYFENNKTRGRQKLNLFYVKQAGRLQCQNGAYLSDADEHLLAALFGTGGEILAKPGGPALVSVQTDSQLSVVRTRLGQKKFSEAIKNLYGNRCCFPGCHVTDRRFLVGCHIARWSDNETLRGHLGNGLCLCLLHDKAFEIGLFTLDKKLQIFVNPRERQSDSSVVQELMPHHGKQIALAEIRPLDDALFEHWVRIHVNP